MKYLFLFILLMNISYSEDYQVGAAVVECDGVVYYEPSPGSILDGLRFDRIYRYQADCMTAKNTYGVSTAPFAFTHPIVALNDGHLPLSCGVCWFNLKDEASNPAESDFVSISKSLPLLDGLENLGTETNQRLNSISSKLKSLDDYQSVLDSNLTKFDFGEHATDIKDSNVTSDLNDLGQQMVDDFDSSVTSFTDRLTFNTQCPAPAPVVFFLLGHSFTIFDSNVLAPFVYTIRQIFIFFAYVGGLFLVFRNI